MIVPALGHQQRYDAVQPISKKLGLWLESTIDSDVVFRAHVEIGRHWGMMANLFCQIEGFCAVIEFPLASEVFSKDWVKGFLDALHMSTSKRAVPVVEYGIQTNRTLQLRRTASPDHPRSES
jgi:hypothetical protein